MSQKETKEFLESLLRYTDGCVRYCSKRSEHAVTIVDKTLQYLMEDSNRISSMSQQTVSVLVEAKKRLQDNTTETGSNSFDQVLGVLKKLSDGHQEVDSVIMPIIMALQFQDRVRQQMENSVKMIGEWLSKRDVSGVTYMQPDEVVAFAKKLVSFTTTEEERIAISNNFPQLKAELQDIAENVYQKAE